MTPSELVRSVGIGFSIAVFAVGPNTACFPPSDLSTTCTIAGSETSCGKCVTSRCNAQIDKCCSDETYGSCGEPELAELERCTTKKDCDDLIDRCAGGTTSGASSELAKCVAEKCSSPCAVSSRACEAATTEF